MCARTGVWIAVLGLFCFLLSESSTVGRVWPKTLLGLNLLMERDADVLWMWVSILLPLGASGIVSNVCKVCGWGLFDVSVGWCSV